MSAKALSITSAVPVDTLEWLTHGESQAAAVLARRTLLGESPDSPEAAALWSRRNEYGPVAAILDSQLEDGSWDKPSQDYRKYTGSLWQVHFLGELWADGADERVARAVDYAFSRQLPDGSWSASNARPAGSITCLTANVGRAVARLADPGDERVVRALSYCVEVCRELGCVNCRPAAGYQLNGYCHMTIPKILLLMAEVPRSAWPDGTEELLGECVTTMRDKAVLRCLPDEAREFNDVLWSAKSSERDGLRDAFLATHPELHYGEKPGWKRFGFPLSYNSDALEALFALMSVGEPPRAEYADAIELVRSCATPDMRWKLRNSFNGKMHADIEKKGQSSRWLTLRALRVLDWAGSEG